MVRGVFTEGDLEVTPSADEHPIEALASDGAYECPGWPHSPVSSSHVNRIDRSASTAAPVLQARDAVRPSDHVDTELLVATSSASGEARTPVCQPSAISLQFSSPHLWRDLLTSPRIAFGPRCRPTMHDQRRQLLKVMDLVVGGFGIGDDCSDRRAVHEIIEKQGVLVARRSWPVVAA